MTDDLIWVSNDAGERYVARLFNETHQEAVERYRIWARDLVKGPPKATEAHSREELEGMGVWGLYRRSEGAE